MHACASMCAYMRVRLQCACRISPCQSSIACFLFFFVNPAILFGALVLLKSAMHTYICCGYGISLDTRELYRFPCPLMVSTRRSWSFARWRWFASIVLSHCRVCERIASVNLTPLPISLSLFLSLFTLHMVHPKVCVVIFCTAAETCVSCSFQSATILVSNLFSFPLNTLPPPLCSVPFVQQCLDFRRVTFLKTWGVQGTKRVAHSRSSFFTRGGAGVAFFLSPPFLFSLFLHLASGPCLYIEAYMCFSICNTNYERPHVHNTHASSITFARIPRRESRRNELSPSLSFALCSCF